MNHKTWAVMDEDKSEVYIQAGDVKYKIIVTVDELGIVCLRLAGDIHYFDHSHVDAVVILPPAREQETNPQ